MTTTYTTALRLPKYDNLDTVDWAAIWAANVQLIEESMTGVRPLTATGGSMSLSVGDGATDDSRQAVLAFTGTLVSNQLVIIPNVPKLYAVDNGTSGSFTLGLKTASSSVYNIPQGCVQVVYCTGSGNVYPVSPAVNRSTGVISSSSMGAAGTNGNLQYNASGVTTGAQAVNCANSGTLVTATAQTAADIPLAIVGAGSQTGNLLEWRQSNGTVLASVSAAGNLSTTGAMVVSGAATVGGSITSTGTIGAGVSATAAQLQVKAGTTSLAAIQLASGSNLTTAAAGAFEYDGVQHYHTIDTTSGRGALPVEQYFHLTAAGSAISTIANFFGATSNISLVPSAYYLIDIEMFYTVVTGTQTVTWTLTNSAAPTSQNIHFEMSPVTGVVAPPGTATMLAGQFINDATAARTVVTAALSAATHYARFRIFLQNGAGTSLKIQATSSANTITPGVNSYWRCRRMSPNNIGTFAA